MFMTREELICCSSAQVFISTSDLKRLYWAGSVPGLSRAYGQQRLPKQLNFQTSPINARLSSLENNLPSKGGREARGHPGYPSLLPTPSQRAHG